MKNHRWRKLLRVQIMQMIVRLVLTGFVLIGLPCSATANGSAYTPGAMGGIEFRYTEGIHIESEILHIHPEKINVTYQFFSIFDAPVELDIAFPVLINDVHNEGDWFLQAYADDTPLLDLQVLVDGEEIKTQAHFSVNKVDITRLLTGYTKPHDVPPYFAYSQENIAFLKNNDIDYDCDQPMIDEIPEGGRCWIESHIDFAFIWKQNFRPGLTRVEVSYKPETGGDYVLYDPESQEISQSFGNAPVLRGDERGRNESYREVFCMDKAFTDAVRRISGWTEDFYRERDLLGFSVVYIWDTARYWQGPIKNFHLIIDKQHKGQIISYCPPVGARTSPTRFEWETKNFVPQGRLQILYLNLEQNDED